MAKIAAKHLTKIFGTQPERALKLLEQGASREEIFNQTGQVVGLANVSFDVEPGEILVVMGLSGSGKSTLIRCINRLIDPTQGSLLIDGVEITTLDHTALLTLRRQKFGMVFQHFALFPHRNVLQNAEYGLEIQDIALEERQNRARQALKLVGLEGWEDAKPSQLSGGMQQRVGLARALAVEPDILLMDEAFSALDPLIRRDMQNELLALQTRVKKTIVFITHDLDEALKIGNRIILMKDGEIVQIGTPEQILTAPANQFVQRFVENIDKTKILTAQSALLPSPIVAYINDSPTTVLRKMQETHINYLLVVQADNVLEGSVNLEILSQAVQRGESNLSTIIEQSTLEVLATSPLNQLIAKIANQSSVVPIVNSQRQLLGIASQNSVLAVLAKVENQ